VFRTRVISLLAFALWSLVALPSRTSASAPATPAALTRPTAFVFIAVDCPIANRYAPTLQALHETFGAQIDLIAVYPEAATMASDVQRHRQAYGLTLPFQLDPSHTLAQACGATVTPEAAVYLPRPDAPPLLLYRGRIDDRYTKPGQGRRAPTQHDLRDTLAAIAAGHPPAPRTTTAVGCYIE
jgi:hypothetical protein